MENMSKKVGSFSELKKFIQADQRKVSDKELNQIIEKFATLARKEKVGMSLSLFTQTESGDGMKGSHTIINAAKAQVILSIKQQIQDLHINPLDLLLKSGVSGDKEPQIGGFAS